VREALDQYLSAKRLMTPPLIFSQEAGLVRMCRGAPRESQQKKKSSRVFGNGNVRCLRTCGGRWWLFLSSPDASITSLPPDGCALGNGPIELRASVLPPRPLGYSKVSRACEAAIGEAFLTAYVNTSICRQGSVRRCGIMNNNGSLRPQFADAVLGIWPGREHIIDDFT